MRKPEIMSPAGYWPQLRAAVEAGADAVYFGLKHFSARAKVGFAMEELPEVITTLHQRGVRGYVTFNTLVFDHELASAARAIADLAHSGVDALIVQDYGISRLAREIAPDLELHASTQMSITDAGGVKLAQAAGLQRVTLARELSLDEIRAIFDQTGCDLEIFVHGALCVSYSGQCFSSEAWGGRSANRGQCAQACRLSYEMLVDGAVQPLADSRYLLSPEDLCALEQMPRILQTGVAALKIEGRYKDADYVALTTRAYRQAVDGASLSEVEKLQLEQVYSRGLGPHFLTGTNHQAVVNGRAPRHRGVQMGRVVSVESDRIIVAPSHAHDLAPLKPGDGIVFDAADWRSPDEPEEGGRIYRATPRHGRIELQFGNGEVRFPRIRPGDRVWRTHDPDLDRLTRPYTQASAPVARQPVAIEVVAREGAPLSTEWYLVKRPEIVVHVASPSPLTPAQNRALTPQYLRDQLGRLGNTAYQLSQLNVEISGAPFAPPSLLNQLRRDAVEKLQALQSLDTPRLVRDIALPTPAPIPHADAPAEIHLLVRTPQQLDAAIALRPSSITLDYLDLYGLRPSIDRIKSAAIPARVASPRILKPGESRILDFLRSLDCPILVRAAGMIPSLQARTLIGDFSLNAANHLTAEAYLAMGLDRLTPTHDLNAEQIATLARELQPGRIEAVAYHHLPVFHTEHCVFCRFLSTGTSYRDCGRPCEKHVVALRDQNGRAHPVLADVGCRNTVFGAEAQQAGQHLALWRRAGIHHFRLEFAHEIGEQVEQVTRAFQSALAGSLSGAQLAAEWKRVAPQGITEGSLFVPAGYLTLPILQ
jgi:putative protease